MLTTTKLSKRFGAYMELNVQHNFQLQKYNTFGVQALATEFVEVTSVDELQYVRSYLAENSDSDFMVLGGGSDVLFKDDYDGLIIRMGIKGIETVKEDDEAWYVRAGAGEVWHSFVRRCLDSGKAGLENLAYIPGTVGAAPIQNIGAYGLEVAERIDCVHVLDMNSGRIIDMSCEECDFSYRSSIFKNKDYSNLVVIGVTFKLPKKWQPRLEYKDLKEELLSKNLQTVTVEDVYSSVIALRQRKLPNPSKLGNAGSFFKNPIVDKDTFRALLTSDPSIVSYDIGGGRYKLSAAWLIDNVGLKGLRMGDVGIYEKQPLVIVNYGRASGEDIFAMAQDVKFRVKNCFGIKLEAEVVII